MDKTTVDEMMIEMITPKINEIKEKFSRGEALTQEDVNMLLLKSQYNHINHLDAKLNQVSDSVIQLENKFLGLEGKFEKLEISIDLKIEKSMNRQLIAISAIMGLFLAISQVLEFLVK